MALCPYCSNALPEAAPRHCPNCGGDIEQAGLGPGPIETGSQVPPVPPPAPPASLGAAPPPAGIPPADGFGADAPPPGRGIPWEERDRLGFAAALIETTKGVLGRPSEIFRAVPAYTGIGSPLLYAVIIGWLGVIAAGFYSAVFQSIVGTGMSSFGENPELAAALGFAQSWGGFVLQVIFAPVGLAIALFLLSGIFHVMLLMLGGARRDFENSFRVVSYAQAPAVLMFIPFCGSFVAWFWTLVLYIIGLAAAHQIGGGKAAAAVLLPLVLVCCCCGLLVGLFASSIMALVSQAQ